MRDSSTTAWRGTTWPPWGTAGHGPAGCFTTLRKLDRCASLLAAGRREQSDIRPAVIPLTARRTGVLVRHKPVFSAYAASHAHDPSAPRHGCHGHFDPRPR